MKQVDADKVHCNTLELALNYHEVMIRYQFRTPKKDLGIARQALLEKCRRYVNMWIELILADKRRQMHASREIWPHWMPWEVNTVWDMPIVLWLSKPGDRNRTSYGPKPARLSMSGDYAC